MATITHDEVCPICSMYDKENKLMSDTGSEKLYCSEGHEFGSEKPEEQLVMGVDPAVGDDRQETTVVTVPVPVELEVPAPRTAYEISGLVDAPKSTTGKWKPQIGETLPGGDVVAFVRIPESNFRDLKAMAREEDPAEMFQRALDEAFRNQWFENFAYVAK